MVVSRANYFQKTGGTQNWKCPNKDMQTFFEIEKEKQEINKRNKPTY